MEKLYSNVEVRSTCGDYVVIRPDKESKKLLTVLFIPNSHIYLFDKKKEGIEPKEWFKLFRVGEFISALVKESNVNGVHMCFGIAFYISCHKLGRNQQPEKGSLRPGGRVYAYRDGGGRPQAHRDGGGRPHAYGDEGGRGRGDARTYQRDRRETRDDGRFRDRNGGGENGPDRRNHRQDGRQDRSGNDRNRRSNSDNRRRSNYERNSQRGDNETQSHYGDPKYSEHRSRPTNYQKTQEGGHKETEGHSVKQGTKEQTHTMKQVPATGQPENLTQVSRGLNLEPIPQYDSQKSESSRTQNGHDQLVNRESDGRDSGIVLDSEKGRGREKASDGGKGRGHGIASDNGKGRGRGTSSDDGKGRGRGIAIADGKGRGRGTASDDSKGRSTATDKGRGRGTSSNDEKGRGRDRGQKQNGQDIQQDNLNMEEAKTMFEDIEKDECNKAVIESGYCKVDIIKDDKVTTTEATDMKEPESLTTTSDLDTIHVEETLATSNTKNQIASIKDFDTANNIQVKNLDEINNNVITTNTVNEIVEETPIVASGVDHNELCDQLDKASNVAIAKDTEKEKNHQEAPNNTPELELETQDKIKEQNNSDFLNEAIENTERCSSDNIIKSSIYHIGECYPKNTTKNEEENNIIADETNETKDATNTLESATDEKDILETVPEILKDKDLFGSSDESDSECKSVKNCFCQKHDSQDNTSANESTNDTSTAANLAEEATENVEKDGKKAKADTVEKKPVKTIQEAIIRQESENSNVPESKIRATLQKSSRIIDQASDHFPSQDISIPDHANDYTSGTILNHANNYYDEKSYQTNMGQEMESAVLNQTRRRPILGSGSIPCMDASRTQSTDSGIGEVNVMIPSEFNPKKLPPAPFITVNLIDKDGKTMNDLEDSYDDQDTISNVDDDSLVESAIDDESLFVWDQNGSANSDESNLAADNPQLAAAGCPLLGVSLVEKDFQPHQVPDETTGYINDSDHHNDYANDNLDDPNYYYDDPNAENNFYEVEEESNFYDSTEQDTEIVECEEKEKPVDVLDDFMDEILREMEEFHKNSLKHPQWNFGAQQTDQIFPTDINCPDSPAIDVLNTVGSGGFIYPVAGTAADYGRGRGGGLYGRTRFTPEPRDTECPERDYSITLQKQRVLEILKKEKKTRKVKMPLKMNLKDVDFAKVAKLENIAEEQNNKEKGVQTAIDDMDITEMPLNITNEQIIVMKKILLFAGYTESKADETIHNFCQVRVPLSVSSDQGLQLDG